MAAEDLSLTDASIRGLNDAWTRILSRRHNAPVSLRDKTNARGQVEYSPLASLDLDTGEGRLGDQI